MYYQIEFTIKGVKRKGYGKISDCEKYMTLVFHDHKNKWSITKESIGEDLFKGSKQIDKETFDYVINQNLRNI